VDGVLAAFERTGGARGVTMSSAGWTLLDHAAQRVRGLDLALTVGSAETRDPIAWAQRVGATALHPNRRLCTPTFVARARGMGLLVIAYTVNRASELAPLLSAGVDGVFTDDPAALRRLLSRRTAAPSTADADARHRPRQRGHPRRPDRREGRGRRVARNGRSQPARPGRRDRPGRRGGSRLGRARRGSSHARFGSADHGGGARGAAVVPGGLARERWTAGDAGARVALGDSREDPRVRRRRRARRSPIDGTDGEVPLRGDPPRRVVRGIAQDRALGSATRPSSPGRSEPFSSRASPKVRTPLATPRSPSERSPTT
jgi:hypothetical protein